MEEKVKKKTTFWLPPDMIDRMDGWLKADNCRSRNEFVEKALRFYMGYFGVVQPEETGADGEVGV